MLVLSEITDNLQAVLGGSVTANQLQCVSNWRDITATAYQAGRTLANTNNTTDVNIVPAPAASTQRVIDFISVFNKDTVSQTVTIKLDANGTEYIIWQGVLNAGERLEYSNSKGFRTLTNTGAEKVQQALGSAVQNTENSVILAADVTNNNAVANTLQNVTGLSFPVVGGNTYWFEAVIPYTAAATTTGSRWTITGPAISILNGTSEYTLTATTKTLNCFTAYSIPAASNASSLTNGNLCTIWGIIKCNASGDVQVQFASEVANSAIIAKAGAVLKYRQIL